MDPLTMLMALADQGDTHFEVGGKGGYLGKAGREAMDKRRAQYQGGQDSSPHYDLGDFSQMMNGLRSLRRPGPQDAADSMGMLRDSFQHFARGGIVDRPTLAMIGEDGPEAVVRLDPRSEFLARSERGQLSLPRASAMGDQEDYGADELDDISGGSAPSFHPELEDEDFKGFWGKLGELGGVQGEVDLRQSGPLGALIALGGIFANMKAKQAANDRAGRVERNKQRQEESAKLNATMEQRDRAFRLEKMRQLGAARRHARGEDESGNRMTYVPGAGYVPTSSQLAQRYLTKQAENAGTSLAPRWREDTGGEDEGPRPAPTISSMEEQDAEARYKELLNKWRSNFWWKRSNGSPENYATWANSPLPSDEMARAEADPQVRSALSDWKRAGVIRVARNARSQEDLDDLEAALERAPAEVRSDPRVLRAVQDAAARVH